MCFGPGDPRSTVPPLSPGAQVDRYVHAVNFTRFYGSIYANVPLEITLAFANDLMVKPLEPIRQRDGTCWDTALDVTYRKYFPVVDELRMITTQDLPRLHYDALSTRVKYIPALDGKDPLGDHYVTTIYGVYMRLRVLNISDETATAWRISCCGSVF